MKLKYEISIDAGLENVWAAFDNPDNMVRWQQGLQSYNHKSGTPGHPGSQGELVFDEKGKKVVLQETITERRKPVFMAGMYESDYGSTLVVNHFEAIDENTTRWVSWCNFRFSGIMRFMSLFIGGAIRRRTEGDMERFKLMVESDQTGQQA